MPAPSPPAAVIFDCDGLLLDTESAWSRAEAVLYDRRGHVFTLAHKRELLGTSGPRARAIIERHLGLPGEGHALMAELHELVFAEIARSAPPQPGATDLLRALRAERATSSRTISPSSAISAEPWPGIPRWRATIEAASGPALPSSSRLCSSVKACPRRP